MSKENNLGDFLLDIADAIRERNGITEKINPQNFAELIREGSLPSSYTQLECIISNGSQYIDTGLKIECSLDLDIEFISRSNAQYMGHSTSGGYYFGVNSNGYYNMSGVTSTISGLTRRTIHVESIGTKLKLTADGNTISSSRSSFNPSYNFMLLGGPSGTGLNAYPTSAKLYSCKIYNTDGILIRNLTPCMNPSGICGLFDKVNQVFYQSATSTPFTGA